jgi:hypothetical protein
LAKRYHLPVENLAVLQLFAALCRLHAENLWACSSAAAETVPSTLCRCALAFLEYPGLLQQLQQRLLAQQDQ